MKVWNYTFIALTMMIVFQFAGMPTSLDGIFQFMSISFNPDNSLNQTAFSTSGFKEYLLPNLGSSGFFGTLLGIGVIAGLVYSGRSDIAIKAVFAVSVLFMFISSLYFVLTYAREIGISAWAVGILGVIFIPFTVGYFHALVEWVTGSVSD